MQDDVKKGVLAICELLSRSDVRYLLVGGVAVALHGYYRHSMGPTGKLSAKPDIDLWFEPSYENYFKLLKVLEEPGVDISEFRNEPRPDPVHSFFRMEMPDFTLDALPRINAAIPFGVAYSRKEEVAVEGVVIMYIGYDDLIEDKKSSGREKDKEDIKHLMQQRDEG